LHRVLEQFWNRFGTAPVHQVIRIDASAPDDVSYRCGGGLPRSSRYPWVALNRHFWNTAPLQIPTFPRPGFSGLAALQRQSARS
jgi:hypothetical protein